GDQGLRQAAPICGWLDEKRFDAVPAHRLVDDVDQLPERLVAPLRDHGPVIDVTEPPEAGNALRCDLGSGDQITAVGDRHADHLPALVRLDPPPGAGLSVMTTGR